MLNPRLSREWCTASHTVAKDGSRGGCGASPRGEAPHPPRDPADTQVVMRRVPPGIIALLPQWLVRGSLFPPRPGITSQSWGATTPMVEPLPLWVPGKRCAGSTRSALSSLTEREQEVVRLRYGLVADGRARARDAEARADLVERARPPDRDARHAKAALPHPIPPAPRLRPVCLWAGNN